MNLRGRICQLHTTSEKLHTASEIKRGWDARVLLRITSLLSMRTDNHPTKLIKLTSLSLMLIVAYCQSSYQSLERSRRGSEKSGEFRSSGCKVIRLDDRILPPKSATCHTVQQITVGVKWQRGRGRGPLAAEKMRGFNFCCCSWLLLLTLGHSAMQQTVSNFCCLLHPGPIVLKMHKNRIV